jgi:hypothetical protein
MSPRAHTSAGAPTRAPTLACSGAIHIGDPMTVVTVAESFRSDTIAAMPKSSTFMRKGTPRRRETAMKRFSGLRSR